MRKLFTSLLVVGVASAAVIGGVTAFFSDTETSTGNILQAGSLDLKIDSTQHYDGMVCALNVGGNPEYTWQDEDLIPENNPRPEMLGTECFGTWDLTDLDSENQFFRLTDIKPGDEGENTISWHVFDNDAWGRIQLTRVIDEDVTCTEPEGEVETDCATDQDGELDDRLVYYVWLDEGATPGFQCYRLEGRIAQCDPTEGDNERQDYETIGTQPTTASVGDTDFFMDMGPALQQAYLTHSCTEPTGHTNYGNCHGLAADGRLVGSATYYMGLAWRLPEETGNEVQTDRLGMDISFEVEQHRNNETPFAN